MPQEDYIYAPPAVEETSTHITFDELELPEEPKPLSFSDVMSASWALGKSNLGKFFLHGMLNYFILLLTMIPLFVLWGTFGVFEDDLNFSQDPEKLFPLLTGSVLLYLLLLLVQTWMGGALIKAIATLAKKGQIRFAEFFKISFKSYFRLLGGYILVGLVSLGLVAILFAGMFFVLTDGLKTMLNSISSEESDTWLVWLVIFYISYFIAFLLFVYPMVRFAYFPMAIVDKGLGPVAALKYSWSLTKNNFWIHIGLAVVMYFLLYISSAFIIPLIWVMPMAYVMYGVNYVYLHTEKTVAPQ